MSLSLQNRDHFTLRGTAAMKVTTLYFSDFVSGLIKNVSSPKRTMDFVRKFTISSQTPNITLGEEHLLLLMLTLFKLYTHVSVHV